MPEPLQYVITVGRYSGTRGFSRHWDTPAGLCEPQQSFFGYTRPLVGGLATQADEYEDPVVFPDGTGILEFSEMAIYDSGGIEFFITAQSRETFQFDDPPVDQYGYCAHADLDPEATSIEFIDIEHSAGTTRLLMTDVGSGGDLSVSGSSVGKSDGNYVDLWFPSSVKVDNLWGASDEGLQYDVTIWRPGDAWLIPPDYNQGTKIKNKKNPGGGVGIEEAEYTATQSFVNEGNDVRPGKGKGRGKSKGKGKGVDVIIKLPDQPGTFDLNCHIEGYDFGSGTWYNILSGANITAGDTEQRLTVSPFITDVVNQSANDSLPYMWRVRVEHGDATAVTYSAEYKLY